MPFLTMNIGFLNNFVLRTVLNTRLRKSDNGWNDINDFLCNKKLDALILNIELFFALFINCLAPLSLSIEHRLINSDYC